ncbi:BAD_collapsed_G0033040.mRNA.1.CDS.1 [Saccharomyces cerevisiae]|nr:BAD_HP_G0021950.mRNA.1.CDS.1 [Saccharomyces cerevisiae]CAI4984433.1 BAD_HP_G0053800.mRNA.1.CDS.1 [Saccharomyces cerevisiae]CAI6540556.1 BAD_HP_G0021950.mRNA.1.CDS.1 [Saccharomyces cerevisiae]CAI6837356.1 BAD_HP_G0053800.mRNA.1.CDS.1 [Saccharomyces cerevisiae]CAI7385862.1 BAD_collapsed_G0033040.mRNA.1.CDS.1 [Saccharomyces cerevisiae]
MKFSTALSVALFALAKMVIADSEEFGLVSIRSGSDLQYLSVYSDNGTLKLGSGSGSFEATITDDGKLKFDDDKYAVVNEDGSFKEGSESDAATGFSIKDGHLNYKSSSGFYAIKDGSSYIFSSKQSDDATGVAIRPTSKSGSVAADFSPSDSSSSSSASASSASASPSTKHSSSIESVETSTTVETSSASSLTASVISQITDGQIQAPNTVYEQTENAGAKAAVGMGAGALAVAAAYLL